MSNKTITSLAILKVNYDVLGKDYLENFVPFVAECIRRGEHDILAAADIQECLKDRFGLEMPQAVVETLLGRARRRGYVVLENRLYRRDTAKLAGLDFAQLQSQVVREYEALLGALFAYAGEHHATDWTRACAETALHDFLGDYDVTLLGARGLPQRARLAPAESPAVLVVAKFVQHLSQSHASEFAFLDTVLKGNMLAQCAFLPDPAAATMRFRGTEIYLDTGFVLSAMGYNGIARQQPCMELLGLLRDTGGRLCCFTHTREEVVGVLEYCATCMRPGCGARDDQPVEALDHFVRSGITGSDLELEIAQITDRLEGLNIAVKERPAYAPRHTINELGLSEALSAAIGYRNPRALERDVASISAVMRLRAGRECWRIEECPAVLVTTNTRLVAAATRFLDRGARSPFGSPCISDGTLATLLWLKRPTAAPDLPRKRIIADCYAAMQPSDDLWIRYLKEIERLQVEGAISSEDYYVLRYSLAAKAALVELTAGSADALTRGTVPEIIEKHRATLQTEARERADREKQELSERIGVLEGQLAVKDYETATTATAVSALAEKITVVLLAGPSLLLVALLAVGTYTTFPWWHPSSGWRPLRYVAPAAWPVAFVAGLLLSWRGGSVRDYVAACRSRLAAIVAARMGRFLHVRGSGQTRGGDGGSV